MNTSMNATSSLKENVFRPSMKKLEDRQLNNEVTHFVWSDRMDLLAVANTKGEVNLYRLNWQRVWTLQPEEHIGSVCIVRAMAWQPSASILAIGYNDGTISLLDVETKDVVHKLDRLDYNDDISCLKWLKLSETSDLNKLKEETALFMPDLVDLPNNPSNAAYKKLGILSLVDINQTNVLLVGTSKGKIYMYIYGVFLSCILDVDIICKTPCKVSTIFLSQDLDTTFVLVETTEQPCGLRMIQLDSHVFRTHACELQTIAYTNGKILKLLNYLDVTVTSIIESWESVLLEMDSKLTTYAAGMPEGRVAAEFLELLIFGFASYELETFLVHTLTEKGVKKLGHSIEVSYSNIQKLVVEHLICVGQQIMYHLAELRGNARMAHRCSILGLQEDLVASAISACGSFLLKGIEMQQVIDHSINNYKAFFRWLNVAFISSNFESIESTSSKDTQMTQKEIQFIGEFLATFDCKPGTGANFNLEKLGQYLVDDPLKVPVDVELNPWNKFLFKDAVQDIFGASSPPSTATCEFMLHHRESSLIQEHKKLITHVRKIFTRPSLAISKLFTAQKTVLLEIGPEHRVTCINYDATTSVFAVIDSKTREFFNFLTVNNATNSHTLVKCRLNPNTLDDAVTMVMSELELDDQPANKAKRSKKLSESVHINDAQFYTSNILSLLVENVASKHCHLVHVPLATLHAKIADYMTNLSGDTGSYLEINLFEDSFNVSCVPIPGNSATDFSLSGGRKVGAILLQNRKRMLLYEMETDDDEQEAANTSAKTELTSSETEKADEMEMTNIKIEPVFQLDEDW